MPFLVNEFIMLAQLALSVGMLCVNEERRDHFELRLVSAIAIIVAFGLANQVPFTHMNASGSTMLKMAFFAVTLALYFPLVLLVFKVTPWQAGFFCVSGYAAQNLISSVSNLLRVFAKITPGLAFLAEPVVYITLSTLLVLPLYLRFYARPILRSGLSTASDNEVILLALVVIFSVIGMDSGIKTVNATSPIDVESLLLLRTGHVLICFFVLFAQHRVLYGDRLAAERQLQQQLSDERERQYQMSRENIEAVNIRCHDLKHQIHELASGSAGVDRQTLEEIAKEISVYDSIVETGNAALDTILTEKSLVCTNAGITLSVIADGAALGFMHVSDIYSLFGNALDNAIESTRELADAEKRVITLNVFSRHRFVSVTMENYYEGERRFDGELVRTTKNDGGLHGMGLRSIRNIAEKYDGVLITSADGGVFRLNVLLTMPTA